MFGYLGCLLIIPLIIFIFLLSFVGSIVRMFFGLGKRSDFTQSKSQQRQKQQNDNPYTDTHSSQSYSSEETITDVPRNRKKVFGDDEGEYTDFEEI